MATANTEPFGLGTELIYPEKHVILNLSVVSASLSDRMVDGLVHELIIGSLRGFFGEFIRSLALFQK